MNSVRSVDSEQVAIFIAKLFNVWFLKNATSPRPLTIINAMSAMCDDGND